MREVAPYKNKLLGFTGVVGDLAHNEIKIIEENYPLSRAIKDLANLSIKYLIVVKNNIAIGTLSYKEISTCSQENLTNQSIKSTMNRLVVSVQKDEPVFETLMFMVKNKLDYVLVVDNENPIGVITQKDWLSIQINYPVQLIKKN